MSVVAKRDSCLVYEGSGCFRMRLLLSVLSGRPVKIENIRSLDDFPGLREYEVNLIRLLDKITNGTVVELNYTGTSVYFQPGLLHGGSVSHECCKLRAISYYLEVLIALAPFCKRPLFCVLTGITNAHKENSVDSIMTGVIPVLKKFLLIDDLSLKIIQRGMAPEGGGKVTFFCPARKSLKSIQFVDMGKVKRIRGVAYAVRVSPTIANRIVESAKGILLNFLPDVYIHTDHCKGERGGTSPGFGISLYAETTTGVVLTSDSHSVVPQAGVQEPSVPEDLGKQAANLLLEEVYRGGCVSSSFQSLSFLWMVLTQKDISKFLSGPLSPYAIKFLQHIQDFFGATFKLDARKKNYDSEEEIYDGATKVLLTCLGIGFTNLSKRSL